MLEIPKVLEVTIPDESMFTISSGAKWLIVIIVGFVLMFQIIKLLLEIGERYVVTSVLTFFAPLAFSMGGSKNTSDIFKGWCRMYGSMMVMMIMNIVFLKLILSAMAHVTTGSVLVWLVFIVALTRVARKIDSHIGKIGLNPAQTGDGVGSRLPGMMTMVAVRTMASTIGRSVGGGRPSGGGRSSGGGGSRPRGSAGTGHTSRNPTNNTSHTSNGSRVNPQQPSGGTSHTSSSTYSSETSSARTTENRPPINRNPSSANGGGSTNVGGGQQTVNNSQSSSSATRFNQNRSGRGGYRKTDKYEIPYLETYSGYDHGNPPPGGVRPNGQTRPSGANPQGHNPMSSNPKGTSPRGTSPGGARQGGANPTGANPKVGNPSVTVPNGGRPNGGSSIVAGGGGRDTVSHTSEHTSAQSHDGKTVPAPASSSRPPITRNPSGGGRDTHITENGDSTTVNSSVTNSSRTPVSQVSSTDRSQNGRQQVKNVQNGAHTDNHITEQGG
ncbi:MAG: hypothetical protein IJG06_09695, partial [Clostridia bacterium]|nr:hypothetical protein [Clostridia bacterium]